MISSHHSVVQVNKLYEIYKYDFQMFGYEHESFVELAKLELHKKKAPPKDSFDLALEQVKKEGKYAQVKLKNKKKGHGKGGRGIKNMNKKNSKIKNKWGSQSPIFYLYLSREFVLGCMHVEWSFTTLFACILVGVG